jgi:hypothetical protein
LYSVAFSNALTVLVVNTAINSKDTEIEENMTNKRFISVDEFIFIISLNDYKKYFIYLYKENKKTFQKNIRLFYFINYNAKKKLKLLLVTIINYIIYYFNVT